MRQIVIIAGMTVMSAVGFAQRVLQTSTNAYLDADRLVKQQIEYPEKICRGNCHDMSNIEVLNKKYMVRYRVKNDSFPNRLSCIENGTQYHYDLCNDSIFIGGYQNRMTQVEYDQAETYLKLPIALGDSLTGYFHGRGTYGGKLALRNYGWYKTKAEALERIVVAEGDTLDNVLRLHTERKISSQYYPIELADSLLPFKEDSVKEYLRKDTAVIKTTIDRWYAPGYRYPILETRKTEESRNVPLLTQTLYFPPSEQQEQLQGDVANETVRMRLAEEQMAKTRGQSDFEGSLDGKRLIGNDFAYDILQDDGSNMITINYNARQDVKVVALVASTQGYVYKRAEQQCEAGTGQFSLNCTGLRKGQYIIYINVDGNQYAEKVNVK